MGLASALSTSLTGLSAAETTIGVTGNNLANASTIGFKESSAIFATQFLQTEGLGSAPSGNSGGTNPQQTGLGTQVAEITPDFSQGTLQVSSSPSDLAIQGDGFFVVQGGSGENLYTRDGQFQTNSENQLVTSTGSKLLGYGVNSNFQVQTTALMPLSIPLGSTAVAQATQNVFFQGDLTATGDLANTAQIIQSAVLGDGQYASPPAGATAGVAVAPTLGTMDGVESGAGALQPGTYDYKVVYVDANGNQTDAASLAVNVTDPNVGVDLQNIPVDATGKYVGRMIYRTQNLATAGPNPVYYLDKNLSTDNTSTSLSGSAAGVDTTSDATLATQPTLNTSSLSGDYSYYVTFVKPGVAESKPSPIIGPQNVTGDRIVLSNLPAPTGQYAGGQVRIYRNLATNPTSFYAVATVNPGQSFVDDTPDTTISNPSTAGYEQLDFNGPKITPNTLLTNVTQYSNGEYTNPFQTGSLALTAQKGGSTLTTQKLAVTNSTTVQNLIDFITQATGIQAGSADPTNPVPGDVSGTAQGGSVLGDGQIQFVSNNGVDNAVTIPLSALQLTPTSGGLVTPDLGFGTSQAAVGQSATADFIAYDSLGIPVNVTVTVDMEARDSTGTTYRWFADSPDNQSGNGVGIAVGTGLIKFGSDGTVESVSNSTVSIDRKGVASNSPLQFNLDFTQLSGLATTTSTLAASRQDGSSAGTLSSYNIDGSGTINGVFTNGVTRNLGQIQLALFANPEGLDQVGHDQYSAGVNSGLPVVGAPGQQGSGSIVAGALEQSNTDIGTNLINLILASTQYSANTRIVTTTQTLFDELLTLGRSG